jgi:hypothetical protein
MGEKIRDVAIVGQIFFPIPIDTVRYALIAILGNRMIEVVL